MEKMLSKSTGLSIRYNVYERNKVIIYRVAAYGEMP